jgi:hypothetical protein
MIFRSPVRFIKMQQGNYRFLALFDPGSELNIINLDCATNLEHTSIPGPPVWLSGIGGSLRIERWLKFTVSFENFCCVEMIAAVAERLQTSLLVGMPFMAELKVKVDFALDVIEAPQIGYVELVSKTICGAWTVTCDLTPDEWEKLNKALAASELGGGTAIMNQLRTLMIEFRDLWQGECNMKRKVSFPETA